jgi:hypothetical protein
VGPPAISARGPEASACQQFEAVTQSRGDLVNSQRRGAADLPMGGVTAAGKLLTGLPRITRFAWRPTGGFTRSRGRSVATSQALEGIKHHPASSGVGISVRCDIIMDERPRGNFTPIASYLCGVPHCTSLTAALK